MVFVAVVMVALLVFVVIGRASTATVPTTTST